MSAVEHILRAAVDDLRRAAGDVDHARAVSEPPSSDVGPTIAAIAEDIDQVLLDMQTGQVVVDGESAAGADWRYAPAAGVVS